MKKVLTTLLTLLLFSGTMLAQKGLGTEVTGNQRETLVKNISAAHQKLKTLSADFIQEKTSTLFIDKVVQKGKFYFKAPKQLRWEYTSPKAFTLIFNDKKTSIITEKGVTNNSNKLLNELGNMIISTINGSNLCDENNFKISFYKNEKSGHFTAVLLPINKRIKENYTKISVVMNGKSHLAEKVILVEKNGDITTISFTNTKIDNNLSSNIFNK